MAAGEWAGVGIAVVVVVLFIVAPLAYWNRKRKRRNMAIVTEEEKGSPELPDTSTVRSSWRDSNITTQASELGADSGLHEVTT